MIPTLVDQFKRRAEEARRLREGEGGERVRREPVAVELSGIESGELATQHPYSPHMPRCGSRATTLDDGHGVRRYECTREKGHSGRHLYHGADRNPCAAWSQS